MTERSEETFDAAIRAVQPAAESLLSMLTGLSSVPDDFTSVAEALHVSQSGVSAQVARLERELGLSLLELYPGRRSPDRQSTPTQAIAGFST